MSLRTILFCSVVAAGTVVCAQQAPAPSVMRQPPQASSAKPAPAGEVNVPENAVVATVNGRKYTAAQILALADGIPIPQAKMMLKRNPQQFLRDHGTLLLFAEEAVKQGLDQKSPYREAIEFARLNVLTNALVNTQKNSYEIGGPEMQAWYASHAADYTEASVRMIHFPAGGDKTEAAAKAKADEAAKKARVAGADFVKIAKEYSADPTGAGAAFTVQPKSAQPPEHMRKVLLASKAGAITDPLKHDNGYYVFRVESVGVIPYDKVRDETFKDIQNSKFNEWIGKIQSKVTVQIDNEAFFRSIGPQ